MTNIAKSLQKIQQSLTVKANRFPVILTRKQSALVNKIVSVNLCSNLSMEGLENTENDLQIDHRTIDYYVITLTIAVQKLRTQYAVNPSNMGVFMNFP